MAEKRGKYIYRYTEENERKEREKDGWMEEHVSKRERER